MDVHSPKNGINRYWSIPICQNMPIFYRPLSEVHYGWKSTKNPCAWWLNPHVFSTWYPLVSWQNYRTSPFLNFIGTSSINGDLMVIFDSYVSYVRFYRVISMNLPNFAQNSNESTDDISISPSNSAPTPTTPSWSYFLKRSRMIASTSSKDLGGFDLKKTSDVFHHSQQKKQTEQ